MCTRHHGNVETTLAEVTITTTNTNYVVGEKSLSEQSLSHLSGKLFLAGFQVLTIHAMTTTTTLFSAQGFIEAFVQWKKPQQIKENKL